MRTVIVSVLAVVAIFTSTSVSANEIYITQSGHRLSLTIVQKGEDNQIKGTGTNISAQVSGTDNTLNINQGVAGNNLLELNVNGNNNDIVVGQEKAYSNGTWTDDTNSYGYHYVKTDVTGDYNDVQIIQRNNDTSSAGHTSYVTITNGDNNDVRTLQTGTGSSNGHHSAVRVNNGRDGNTVDILQNSDTADQRLELSIYSSNNTIDIDQTGTANQAYVLFSGSSTGPTDFTLSQNGGDTYGNIDTGSYASVYCGNINGCIMNVSQ